MHVIGIKLRKTYSDAQASPHFFGGVAFASYSLAFSWLNNFYFGAALLSVNQYQRLIAIGIIVATITSKTNGIVSFADQSIPRNVPLYRREIHDSDDNEKSLKKRLVIVLPKC
jgi:hypothetical protein